MNECLRPKYVAACTGGARSRSGCYGELQTFSRSKSLNASWTHLKRSALH